MHMSPPLQKQQRPIRGRQKLHRSILVIAQQWELRLLGTRCAFSICLLPIMCSMWHKKHRTQKTYPISRNRENINLH